MEELEVREVDEMEKMEEETVGGVKEEEVE